MTMQEIMNLLENVRFVRERDVLEGMRSSEADQTKLSLLNLQVQKKVLCKEISGIFCWILNNE